MKHAPSTSNTVLRRVVAGTVFAGVSLGVMTVGTAGIAGASTAAPIDTARTRCLQGIDKRITALNSMTTRIDADKFLTDDHQSRLEAIVGTALTGMTTLRPQVEADVDAAGLKAHCTSVVNDYRVFALVTHQVHLTRATDAATSAKAKIAEGQARIDEAIEAAQAAGKDVARVTADDATLDDAVVRFDADLAAVPSVLDITPAQFNADKTVLDSARTSLRTVRADGKAVRDAAKVVRADLKALKDS